MNHDAPAYGLWALVFINSAVFLLFAFSFARPGSPRDWRSFGGFSAFIIALFAEMYGFPLTIYLLSGWIGRRFPGVDVLSHDGGHLWWSLLGLQGDPHSNPVHILSIVMILVGLLLLASSWQVLHAAQQEHRLASTGPYATIRHPQYVAFVAILFGFLLQWPTLLTLLMFPVLVTMYVRLARQEEREVRQLFGAVWDRYAERTPAFIPRLRRHDADGHPLVRHEPGSKP